MSVDSGDGWLTACGHVLLDFGSAASPDILRNLSGAATCGNFMWTVSDEGRTLECLELKAGSYRLAEQHFVDDFVRSIPGVESGDELDLEAIACDGDNLWICGSHCRVRKKPEPGIPVNWELKNRKSRRLLACFKLGESGGHISKADWLPFDGPGSLRETLERDLFIQPFSALPSKENGIDIEGLAVRGDLVFVGLRGPRIDNQAMVLKLTMTDEFRIGSVERFFVDLDGLAVRDLNWLGKQLLILAGPVGDASGPFRLCLWDPQNGSVTALHSWDRVHEKPEGVCWLRPDAQTDLIVIYDSPDDSRISTTTYRADRFALNQG
ncbi:MULTISPECIES: DUF3616 domain-containing protein [Rhizobium]|uniref:DUF3616 domain-containing protein n=1 Tax=Rhizobium TaxID=379 RepID=UPI001031C920|nr:DUF3616 domain-containing protein [Rhizobium ruizarguesonis]TAZ53207.1 DUF3616 domain-containing protein [Rhizobium ruizarguesonis]